MLELASVRLGAREKHLRNLGGREMRTVMLGMRLVIYIYIFMYRFIGTGLVGWLVGR
jgi:hypothetical protein